LSLLAKKLDRYDSNIRIGLESIHWKYQDKLTYISTLADALAVVKEVDRPNIGLMVDLYHVWQETDILSVLREARGRIVGCQVADWRPITRCRLDRVLMGDGCIPITELLTAIEAAGWDRWYDVEILSDELWKMDGREFIKLCVRKYKSMCKRLPTERILRSV
jgi:sugar phosphate isomerase/epimerase